ncbi:hypothetical protein P7C71_g6011, partial [Lecanoromycetidae sp. Uapishka_2]
MPPTIIFVPGFWEGSAPFEHVASLLQSQGYATHTAILPSTGSVSPKNPNMLDDVAAIRTKIAESVDKGEEVVLVLHSAGGFLGSNAIEGLTVEVRRAKGLQGGVKKIVFLAGGVAPEGFKHQPLPFCVFEGGAMNCVTPEKILFNDLDHEAAQKWAKTLQTQPATGWDGMVTYCGWREVPSVYLMCENDNCIPPPMQLQMAEMAGSRIERCAAGHMLMLSMPEKAVEIVKSAADEA